MSESQNKKKQYSVGKFYKASACWLLRQQQNSLALKTSTVPEATRVVT